MILQGTNRSCSLVLLLTGTAWAQDGRAFGDLHSVCASACAPSGKAPSVSIAPVPLVTAQRATQTMVDLNFRVAPGFHINSNTPKSEFLIPPNLKMDLPTDIILGKIEYPAGKDLSFPFSPDEKLNVYSGDFTIAVAVHPLHAVCRGNT